MIKAKSWKRLVFSPNFYRDNEPHDTTSCMHTLTFCIGLLLASSETGNSLAEPRLDNAHTLAMGGAGQSNSFSNIAMVNNASAMVFFPRYAIETAYFRDSEFGWKTWITSLLDSTNRAFSGGITYSQSKTADSSTTLHQLIGSSGFALGQTMSFGVNVRRIQGRGDNNPLEADENFWSSDISLSLRASPQWITSWAWRSIGKRPKAPMPSSAQLISTAWLGMGYTIALDIEIPMLEDQKNLYKLGAEYIAAQSVPLRIGWNYSEQRGNQVAAGIGWIEKTGALDLSVSKNFSNNNAWTWSAGLRLFY